MGFPGGSERKASACNAGDLGSIPVSGKIPWRRERLPTQYSGLENSMNYNGIAKSRTRLSNFHFSLHEDDRMTGTFNVSSHISTYNFVIF